ncbi:MAG: hypothetical protein P4L46_14930 [Fimbriimonas sp.]|nr:hypothetical protein [Fimbriimonas sp.]
MQGEESNVNPSADPKQVEIDALRAEWNRLKVKCAETKDRDILSVLNMRIDQIEISLKGLGTDQSVEGHAAAEPGSKSDAEEVDVLVNLPEPTPAELEEAERLIRQARLEKQRGNQKAATAALTKATEVAPGSAVVIEAMADDLLERKLIKEARKLLKQAVRLDPKNVGLERKYAETVLRGTSSMSVEDQLRYGVSDSVLLSGNDNVAGIVAARFLSAFIPGVGQMVIGRSGKGIVLFVCYALCFGLLVLWQDDVKALLLMFSKTHTGSIHPQVFVPIVVGTIVWIAAMADLSGGGSRTQARHTKVDRPIPPVDLPFE